MQMRVCGSVSCVSTSGSLHNPGRADSLIDFILFLCLTLCTISVSPRSFSALGHSSPSAHSLSLSLSLSLTLLLYLLPLTSCPSLSPPLLCPSQGKGCGQYSQS